MVGFSLFVEDRAAKHVGQTGFVILLSTSHPSRRMDEDPRSLSFKLVGTLAAGEFRHVSALGYVGAETWVYVEPAWSKLAVYVMDDAAMGAAMHRLSGDVAILKVRNRRGDLKPSRWFTGRWCVPTIAQLVGSSSGALRPDALWRDLISEGAEIVVHGKRCQLDYRRMGRRSPYLWAGTSHQQIGKYVADGKFDPGVTDRQPGVMPIIARVLELDSGSQLPSPAIPSKADLEVEADHQKERAEAAAGGAVVLGAGGGGAGSAEAIRPAAPSDAVAAVDWTSVALWFGAIGLLCLAVWLVWRVGLLARAEVALRRAAAELDAWADKRAALPGPAYGYDWTQTAR
jgi:hypothetical protein